MKKFLYTSSHLKGEIILGYHDTRELLVFVDLQKAEIDDAQHETFLRHFPLKLRQLQDLVSADKINRKIVEIVDIVTFEMMWIKYDYKLPSHKKKSESIWKKMSEGERLKAYEYIDRYNRHLQVNTGVGKKHLETFLNAEQWNN